MGDVCKHGHLERSCQLCEVLAELEAEKKAHAETKRTLGMVDESRTDYRVSAQLERERAERAEAERDEQSKARGEEYEAYLLDVAREQDKTADAEAKAERYRAALRELRESCGGDGNPGSGFLFCSYIIGVLDAAESEGE